MNLGKANYFRLVFNGGKTYYIRYYIRHMGRKMQTKLTLRLEEQLIDNAKRFAKQSGKSLSQMVADYFTLLEKHTLTNDKELPTVTASLKGVLQVEPFQGLDEIDYRTYLESKYL